MERARGTLAAVTGSQALAAVEMKFVSDLAGRLGLSLTATAEGYARVTAAAKGTKMEGAGARDVFVAISTAAEALKLPTENVSRIFYALDQMMSTGQVNARELKMELGMALPGAMEIAAKSMGMTTIQLEKMMEKGELFADDFLPKFAKGVQEHFGAGAKQMAEGPIAQFNRLENAVVEAGDRIAQSGLMKGLGNIAKAMAEGLDSEAFKNFTSTVGSELGALTNDVAKLANALSGVGSVSMTALTELLKYSDVMCGLWGAQKLAGLLGWSSALGLLGTKSTLAALASKDLGVALQLVAAGNMAGLAGAATNAATAVGGLAAATRSVLAAMGPVGWAIIGATTAYEALAHARDHAFDSTEADLAKQKQSLDAFIPMIEKVKAAGGDTKPVREWMGQSLSKDASVNLPIEKAIELAKDYTEAATHASIVASKFRSAVAQLGKTFSGVFASAIEESTHQISTWNELLSKNREIMKQAVGNESKSWQEIGKNALQSTTETTDRIAREYVIRRDKMGSMQVGGNGAQISEEEKIAGMAALNANEIRDQLKNAQLDEIGAINLVERGYQVKLAMAERLKEDTGRINEEKLGAEKAILGKTEGAYRQSIDQLIAEEKRHLDAASNMEQHRQDAATSVNERLQRLKEKDESPQQVYADRQKMVQDMLAKAEEARAKGNFSLAEKYSQKSMDMAEAAADKADNPEARKTAMDQIMQAAKIQDGAMVAGENAYQQAAASARGQYQALQRDLEDLRGRIGEIKAQMAGIHRFDIQVNDAKIKDAAGKIDDLTKKITDTTAIRDAMKALADSFDQFIQKVDAGTAKSKDFDDQIVSIIKTSETWKKNLATFDPEIRAKADLSGKMQSLAASATQLETLRTTLETMPALDIKTDPAIDSMKKVEEILDRILEKQAKLNGKAPPPAGGDSPPGSPALAKDQAPDSSPSKPGQSAIPPPQHPVPPVDFSDGVKKTAKSIGDSLKNAKDYWENYFAEGNTIKKPDSPEAHHFGGIVGQIRHYSGGGLLPGRGSSDDVNAKLTRGEFVVRQQAVDYYGPGLLYAINEMKIGSSALAQGFHNGGWVQNFPMPPPLLHFSGGGMVPAGGGQGQSMTFGDIHLTINNPANGAAAADEFLKTMRFRQMGGGIPG